MSGPVRIRRAVPVSVRRQIAAELEEGILDGALEAGRRLPSVRELARTLGVHRNTVAAAYRDLERAGLAAIRPGSGVYVRRLAPPPDAPAVLLGRLLRASRAAGEPGAAGVAARLAARLHALEGRRLAVVEEEPGLRSVLVAELSRGLPGSRVAGVSVEAARAAPGRLAGRIALARPSRLDEVTALVAPWGECLPLRARIPPAVRRAVEALPAPRILAAVTRSALLRRRLRELAWRRHGAGTGFLACGPHHAAALGRIVRFADLVLVDLPSEDPVAAHFPVGKRPRRLPLRVVDPRMLPELLDVLDVRMDRNGKPER